MKCNVNAMSYPWNALSITVLWKVEMGIIFVNELYFWEQTNFFVNDDVVQRKNEQWTNYLDCSEKGRKNNHFSNRKKKPIYTFEQICLLNEQMF